MAVASVQVVVANTATAIVSDDVDGQRVVIKNLSGSRAIFIGDSAVTKDNGFKLSSGEEVYLYLGPGEEIYGITSAGTADACYIATMNQ